MNPSDMPATQLQTDQPADWPVAPGWQPLVDAFFAGARGQALLASDHEDTRLAAQERAEAVLDSLSAPWAGGGR